MLRYYNKENIKKNYIHCYAKADIKADELIISNYVYNTVFQIRANWDVNITFLKMLYNGVSYEELSSFVQEKYGFDDNVYAELLRKEIIE